jgi:hypothetical protein
MNIWILYEREPRDDATWEVNAVYTSGDRAREDMMLLEIDQMKKNQWTRTRYTIEEHEVTE